MRASFLLLLLFLVLLLGAVGCSGAKTQTAGRQGDGVASVPSDLREEYALFSQRCSKCHSLARVLNNGEHDATYWARYVERMRRQPSSGIAPEEAPPILRYLNHYSAQLRAESATDAGTPP